MSKTPKPVIHKRDHEHGGADPIRIVWESVGDGGGGGAGTGGMVEVIEGIDFSPDDATLSTSQSVDFLKWFDSAMLSGGAIGVDPSDDRIIFMPTGALGEGAVYRVQMELAGLDYDPRGSGATPPQYIVIQPYRWYGTPGAWGPDLFPGSAITGSSSEFAALRNSDNIPTLGSEVSAAYGSPHRWCEFVWDAAEPATYVAVIFAVIQPLFGSTANRQTGTHQTVVIERLKQPRYDT